MRIVLDYFYYNEFYTNCYEFKEFYVCLQSESANLILKLYHN